MQSWIDALSALLTPVIAIVAVYIAYQQSQTNRRKLKLDLYDRRLRIYQAVATFIGKVLTDFSPQSEDFSDFWRNTAEADFLFGRDRAITDYLQVLATHAAELRKWRSEYRDYTQPKPEGYDHKTVADGLNRESAWFAEQPEAARRLFGRYLSMAPERRLWRRHR